MARYLGLPDWIGRSKCEAFGYLSQRIQNAIQNWYVKLLSPAGKEVLIKAVVTALPAYTMSCFMLPRKLLAQITSLIRRFWWSSDAERRKLAWVAWAKITKSKTEGGLGIHDLKAFNVALLAKQGWRLITNPQSLLAKVYKAKYYSHSTFLEVCSSTQSSYVWKSLIQTQALLKRGIRWRVGNGKAIKVWQDNWLPVIPSRPAQGPGALTNPRLTVNGLLCADSTEWDQQKLRSNLSSEDIRLVRLIRPAHEYISDNISWVYTKAGEYSVKSGYHVQLTMQNSFESVSEVELSSPRNLPLYKAIWNMDTNPKIKLFWWRISHNSLPVGTALQARGCHVNLFCPLCNEAEETINHLIFQCRVAREVWELAPCSTPAADILQIQSLFQNLESFLLPSSSMRSNNSLFSFIGWRIWKMRNNLIFRQKKESIPAIINKSLMDYNLWQDSKCVQEQVSPSLSRASLGNAAALKDFLQAEGRLCCVLDASWVSDSQFAGLAWILYQEDGQCLLKSKASIEPISSPLEAEAQALVHAVKEMMKLGFSKVTFIGDCKTVFDTICRLSLKSTMKLWPNSAIANTIKALLHSIQPQHDFKFKHASRRLLAEVDKLAKLAQKEKSNYVVSWQLL